MFGFFIFTNCVFVGLLLLLKPSRIKKANIFLSFFLFSLSLAVIPGFFEESIFLPETSFLTVPLLFLYVRRLIKPEVKPIYYLLFLPAILSNVLVNLEPFSGESVFLTEMLIQVPFYGFNLWLLFNMKASLTAHQRTLKDQFTNLDHRTLEWVKRFVWIFLIFHLVWVIQEVLKIINFESRAPAIVSQILTLLSVFLVGYHGLSQRESYVQTIDTSKLTQDPSDLNEFNHVKRQIEHSKLYLNQDLTLRLLAQQVSVNEKKLSVWISIFTKENFYFMINSYRIEEFKSQLTNPKNKNYSLKRLAQNSGFKNKPTFYSVFKEFEGITPKEYKSTTLVKSKV